MVIRALTERFRQQLDSLKDVNAITSATTTIYNAISAVTIVVTFVVSLFVGDKLFVAFVVIAFLLLIINFTIALCLVSVIIKTNKQHVDATAKLEQQHKDALDHKAQAYSLQASAMRSLLRISSDISSKNARYDLHLNQFTNKKEESDFCKIHAVEILNYTALAFRTLTRNNYFATIKCAVIEADTLATLCRDQRCFEKRGKRDTVDALSKYRPINRMARGELMSYVEDDLERAWRDGEFMNAHSDWRQHYNATIMHRIPLNLPSDNTAYILCVDNIGGGFRNQYSDDVMRCAFSMLSSVIYRIESNKIASLPSQDST